MSAVAMRNNDRAGGMVLKAVIIYDDFDAATHATMLLERAALGAEDRLKWDIKPWRLEVLKQPALAALTVAVAANADLILLALSRINTRRVELDAWLQNWAECRRIPDAAVLALSPGDPPSAFWNELKTFAEKHHLVLLNKRADEDLHTAPLKNQWQGQSVPADQDDIFSGRLPLPSHWGINE